MVLGVPILKHFRVMKILSSSLGIITEQFWPLETRFEILTIDLNKKFVLSFQIMQCDLF